MLAHYPGGSSARYVTHLDNDPSDPGHREGAPGTRACDRAVTAILYLNPGWEEKHGGCLRIELEDGRGEADVAPSWGRLVMFFENFPQLTHSNHALSWLGHPMSENPH